MPGDARLNLAYDEMKARIAYDGVAVDGRFASFEKLVDLIQTYEGFHFSLRIVDPYDL